MGIYAYLPIYVVGYSLTMDRILCVVPGSSPRPTTGCKDMDLDFQDRCLEITREELILPFFDKSWKKWARRIRALMDSKMNVLMGVHVTGHLHPLSRSFQKGGAGRSFHSGLFTSLLYQATLVLASHISSGPHYIFSVFNISTLNVSDPLTSLIIRHVCSL